MRRSILTLALVASLAIVSTISVNFVSASKDESNITLTILVNRGKILIDNALDVLRNETNAVIDGNSSHWGGTFSGLMVSLSLDGWG